MVKKIVRKLTKPIIAIYNNIMCGVKLLKNAPKCMIYYILDMIGYVIYLPFMIFFWMFGLQSIEREFFKALDKIDKAVYSVAEFHIFRYPESLLNRCYRCKNKKETKGTSENWLDKYLAESDTKDHRVTFFELMLLIIGILFLFYCAYYYLNLQKVYS